MLQILWGSLNSCLAKPITLGELLKRQVKPANTREQRDDHRTSSCAPGCASWPMNAAASAIAGCSSCCGGRASRRVSTGSTGSTGRKGSQFASGGPVARPQAPERRSWSKRSRMHAGRWTSSMTSSPMDGASASSTSSTMSPRNAWVRSRTRRSPDGG